MARGRAFESYHAKTIFIKATCYHCISSSPNPYITRKCVSEPVPVLCSVKWLSELLLGAGRWDRQLPAGETRQPAALQCSERDWECHPPDSHRSRRRGGAGGTRRETGWEKEVGMGKGMRGAKKSRIKLPWGKERKGIKASLRRQKRCSARTLLKSDLGCLQATGNSRETVWDAWKPAGAWALFCCTGSLITPVFKSSHSCVVWIHSAWI